MCIIGLQCEHKKNGANAGVVFHYNQPNNITSLDPAFAKSQNNMWAVDHLYNQLIELDSQLNFQAEIAKSWEIDSAGKIYRFIIDKRYHFIDDTCFKNAAGRPVNAFDVEYSFKRLTDYSLASPGAWLFAGKVDSVHGFKAINDSIFEIRLIRPFSPLLQILTMQYCSIVSHEAVLFYGNEFRKNPVGTGPFYLKKWVERQGMFLRKNKQFLFAENYLIDGIRISFIDDRNTAYLEFLKKGIDFFSGIQSSFALQLLNKDGQIREDMASRIQMLQNDFLNVEYIGIQFEGLSKDHPLRNLKVRQAMNYAIDRKLLVKTLRYNLATPAEKGFIPKGLPAYVDDSLSGYEFNIDKAKQLIGEAAINWSNQEPLQIYTNKDYIDLITFVARQWEDLGIPVRIELLETATLRERMRNGNVQLFRGSWIADYPDEENFMAFFYGKNPAPPNYSRYKNTVFDTLYEQALVTIDISTRLSLYRQMNRILIMDAAIFPLFYDRTCWFTQPGISGLQANPLNMLKLHRVVEKQN